jgi:trehalose/maltose hydrolase-like predicted phosphorylase
MCDESANLIWRRYIIVLQGRTFWDYDTFTAPVMMLLHPDLAESVIDYRLHRLPGARAKAASYNEGFEGAMFPWGARFLEFYCRSDPTREYFAESAFTGLEACPSWADMGKKEIHISGDVAISVWQMWQERD